MNPEIYREGLELVDEQEIRLLEDDLYSYTEDAWPILQPQRVFKGNWHIGAICDHLSAVQPYGHIKKLVINIPPRSLKSLLTSVFWPSHVWTKKPAIKWLYLSYGRALVLRDAVNTRHLIKSQWYQDRWGDRYHLMEDQQEKKYFINDQGGARLTSSFDSDPTGEGGDVIVVDDPLQISDAFNDAAIKHVNDVWDGVLSTRLNDPVEGARVIIMQRLNPIDLTGHVLKELGWTLLRLPQVYEPKFKCVTYMPWDVYVTEDEVEKPKPGAKPFFEDPRTEEGQLLHPERFPQKIVDQLRRTGDLIFAGQQQQRPVPLRGNIFHRDKWNYYRGEVQNINWDDTCQSWDCSYKDKKTSSYVSCTIWARVGSRIYLIYRLHRRMQFPETLKAYKSVHEMYPLVGPKLIEAKANGIAIIQMLRDEIPGIIEIEPDGGKESRAHAVSYMQQSGNIYLPDPDEKPWIKEYIDQLADFPMASSGDDDVDSSTQAWYHWFHLRPAPMVPLIEILQVGQNQGSRTFSQTRVF